MDSAPSLEEIAKFIERSDADQWADWVRAAPAHEVSALGINLREDGGTVAGMTARVDILALNRAINLGMQLPASEVFVDTIVEGYRAANVPRFFIQLSPVARPANLPDWLGARGMTHYNNWVKLYRGLEDCPEVATDLHIEQIDATSASSFAEIVTSAFGWPESLRPWFAGVVGRPRWRHYIAFDGRVPAATAAMYVNNGIAWFGFAGTAQEYRKRGAQSALIGHRIRDARAMGCKWLTAETAEDKPERPSPSYHNMLRMGFRVAYLRPNYLWRAENNPM